MADDLTEALEPIRERHALTQQGTGDGCVFINRLAACTKDVPTLLAAVDAVLDLHKPEGRTYEIELCDEHTSMPSVTAPVRFEVQSACPSCRRTERVICWQNACRDYGWPCPTYQAISRALGVKTSTEEGAQQCC
jgi:hypothetical protein